MCKRKLILILIFIFIFTFIYAQETDPPDSGDDPFAEDDIFGEGDIFSDDDIFSDEAPEAEEEEKKSIFDDTITDELDLESVTFSGLVKTSFTYNFNRDFLQGEDEFEDNQYSAYVGADLMLDIRFRRGIKAFADLYVGYLPTGQDTQRVFTNTSFPYNDYIFLENVNTVIILKEFFIDTNINHHVYFRFGKQVTKWGRGYLWNPTDFINIERRSFLNMNAIREGVYGLRLHIPIKTLVNIYSFINVTDTDNLTDFGYSNKLEFLIKNVETSLSVWGKKDAYPMFGWDISFNLFDIDFRGEASFSYGHNTSLLRTDGSSYKLRNQFVPRFCIGLTKSFDIGNVTDRLTITPEFYYNHAGYEDDMFENLPTLQTFIDDYYEFGNYGKIYSSLFVNVKKFIISDMQFNMNLLGNLTDLSFILSTGITYNPIYNVTFDCDVLSYLGKESREFTFGGEAIALQLGLSLRF